MNFNKKIFLFAVFALGSNLLFADKQIGLVPSSVKNERDILQVGVLEGDIPVLVLKEEREGFVSTITEYFVIYDKEKAGPFDDIDTYYTHFSPDGKNLVYSARIDRKEYLFIGKEKIGPFDKVYFPEFSPDGKNLAYSAEIDGKWYLFIGKEKIGPFDNVYSPEFSPDGKNLAYKAKIDGKWYGRLFFNSKTYTGSICGGKVVYIKDGKIMLKD